MLIPHPRPLLECRLLARYDRFIARVRLGRREVDAHCVNPGRMEGLVRPGCKAWVSQVPPESTRKLRYTLELLEIDGIIIGANTVIPNHLAEQVVRAGLIPRMKRFSELRREVRYGEKSRIDMLLTQGKAQHYVEVKNCHLVYPDQRAYFPDSVSTRAAGHLRELATVARNGDKASVLFILQRKDGVSLRPSALHDPMFAQAARDAAEAGVVFQTAQFAPEPDSGFTFLRTLPVDLKPYAVEALSAYRDALASSSGWLRRGRQRDRATSTPTD